MGTWLLFEVLRRLQTAGVRMPSGVLVSGFPSPDIPLDQRPWPRTDEMNEAEFQAAVKVWDPEHFDGPAKALFTPGVWETFAYMRSDFKLFETYELGDESVKPFACPFRIITTSGDAVVNAEHTAGWKRFATDAQAVVIPGGHNQVMFNQQVKAGWVKALTGFVDEQLAFDDMGF
jgi:surfactin synthase thioesterase subunit